jgi:hypothetical protein
MGQTASLNNQFEEKTSIVRLNSGDRFVIRVWKIPGLNLDLDIDHPV